MRKKIIYRQKVDETNFFVQAENNIDHKEKYRIVFGDVCDETGVRGEAFTGKYENLKNMLIYVLNLLENVKKNDV